MRLTPDQKRILNLLLDRFENSKTYSGENKVNQNFSVKITEVWPAYEDDFTDTDEIEEMKQQLLALQSDGLVDLKYKKDNEIISVAAVLDKVSEYYSLLGRKEKRVLISEELDFYREYKNRDDELGAYAKSQEHLLISGKKAKYEIGRAKKLVALTERILSNQSDLYERELSVEILKDTKLFETSYRRTVCNILKTYGDCEKLLTDADSPREEERLILEQHSVYSNPGYVFIKGEAEILLSDGVMMKSMDKLPIALSEELINEVIYILPKAEKIITIENLTTFHRFSDVSYFCIFLSGYHSTRIGHFLKKIKKPGTRIWFHFGDIDPDGFMILKNLNGKTEIPFVPYKMDEGMLLKYSQYTKPLEEQDRKKAESLIASNYYSNIMKYMIDNNCKLEQEIVENT